MTTVTSAWTNRQFRRYWGAGAASTLGGEVGELAIPVLALITLGASATELSLIRAALLIPYLLLTLWLGVVVDRSRRRPLMIAADAGRGLLLAAVCVLALTRTLTVPMLVIAASLLGSLTVLYSLAEFAFLPLIVEDGQLLDANARVTATQSAIGIAGAGAGGALIQAIAAPLAVGVNALGYLFSGALIATITAAEPRRATGRTSAFREARDGMVVLLRQPVLRGLVAEASIWNFGNEVFMIALAILFLQDYEVGPLAFGVVLMCGGVGAFLGSVSSRRLTDRFGYGPALIVALVLGNTAPLIGILWAGHASLQSTIAMAVAFLASGFGIGIANSQAVSIRQLAIAPDIRGRANAAYRLASWGFLALGALAGGLLVTIAGAWPAAVAGTAVMAMATTPVALSPVRRVVSIADITHTEQSAAPINAGEERA